MVNVTWFSLIKPVIALNFMVRLVNFLMLWAPIKTSRGVDL